MATLLFVNARILTMHGDGSPRRGDSMRDLAIIEKGWLLTKDQMIGDLGDGEPPEGLEPDSVIDLDGRVLMPSFVDCHTHACWAGSRLDEFQKSLATINQLLDCPLTPHQIAELMTALDTDGDGVLSYKEFFDGFKIVDTRLAELPST